MRVLLCLIQVWKSGLARAVGVSNFNTTHLNDIAEAGLEMPSANQCSFAPVVHGLDHKVCCQRQPPREQGEIRWPYCSTTSLELCVLWPDRTTAHQDMLLPLVVKGCTPLGKTETCRELLEYSKSKGIVYNGYSPFGGAGGAAHVLANPVLTAIAARHNVSSAQVALNWQWTLGIPVFSYFNTIVALYTRQRFDFPFSCHKLTFEIHNFILCHWGPFRSIQRQPTPRTRRRTSTFLVSPSTTLRCL